MPILTAFEPVRIGILTYAGQRAERPGDLSMLPLRTLLRLGFVLLLAFHLALAALSAAENEPQPPPLTAAQKERLQERDKYGELTAKYRQQGKLAEAIQAAEKMLAIEREVIGNFHEEVAGSLEQLAEMHEQREDFAVARKARHEVLAIRTKQPGDKHWRVTDARLQLDDLKLVERLSPEDRALLREAVQLSNRVYHLWRAGKYKEALPQAQRAVETLARILGKEHYYYAMSLYNLGAQYHELAAHSAARAYYEHALAIRKKVLGLEHPHTGQSLNNLGSLLQKQGDYAAARAYFEQALAVSQKALGSEHRDTATCQSNLS